VAGSKGHRTVAGTSPPVRMAAVGRRPPEEGSRGIVRPRRAASEAGRPRGHCSPIRRPLASRTRVARLPRCFPGKDCLSDRYSRTPWMPAPVRTRVDRLPARRRHCRWPVGRDAPRRRARYADADFSWTARHGGSWCRGVRRAAWLQGLPGRALPLSPWRVGGRASRGDRVRVLRRWCRRRSRRRSRRPR
jgi:hypothetical protein